MERIKRFKGFSFNSLNNFFFKHDTSVWDTTQTVIELKLFLFPFFPKKRGNPFQRNKKLFSILIQKTKKFVAVFTPPFLIAYRHFQPEGDAER